MSSDEDQAGGDGTGISHASSHNKRQKMTKSVVLVGEEEDVLTSILPLRLAVLGGYLPLKDTGRFLLRVNKDMTASIFEERMSLGDAASAAVGGTGDAKNATCDGEGVPNDGSEAADTEANAISLRQGMARNEAWKFLCEQKWGNTNTLEQLVSLIGGQSACELGATTVWETLRATR